MADLSDDSFTSVTVEDEQGKSPEI
ncbi:hypothetical protein EYZ11_001358 [Aspergillus tanneri]|uniref:Uncharacterized protein n=1 Tax=Aspergillus tanneri TaxID=1220188 RepID=A0A4S3JUX4_9EURO|nr:hypothetical protein EYZ11_001358 [Aspergillus tanneri]